MHRVQVLGLLTAFPLGARARVPAPLSCRRAGALWAAGEGSIMPRTGTPPRRSAAFLASGRSEMARPLSPQTLVYDFTPAGDPQVSPDGTRVVYTLSKTDRESKRVPSAVEGKGSSQLWLCGIDGDNPRQLTFAGEK